MSFYVHHWGYHGKQHNEKVNKTIDKYLLTTITTTIIKLLLNNYLILHDKCFIIFYYLHNYDKSIRTTFVHKHTFLICVVYGIYFNSRHRFNSFYFSAIYRRNNRATSSIIIFTRLRYHRNNPRIQKPTFRSEIQTCTQQHFICILFNVHRKIVFKFKLPL